MVMRLKSLDALRGIAAAFVVLHHWVFIFTDTFPRPEVHSMSDLVTDLVYDAVTRGPSAVLIFFVLSGFVLTLSLREGEAYWLFVAKRFIRIYPPYLASAILAIILIATVPLSPVGLSHWFDEFSGFRLSPDRVFGHLLMFGSPKYEAVNSVSWSLVHEMRISVIFPILVFVVRRSTWKALTVLAMISITSRLLADQEGAMVASYLMTGYYAVLFSAGIAIALNFAALENWFGLRKPSTKVTLFLLILVLLAIPVQIAGGKLAVFTVGLGACGLVFLCAAYVPLVKFLHNAVLLFLGRISYSLYLIHWPIMLGLIHTLYGKVSTPPLLIGGTLLIFGSATLLNWLVEKPSQWISHTLTNRAPSLSTP